LSAEALAKADGASRRSAGICPLLAIDAFSHGGTPEFAVISAVVQRHNEISNVLSTAPHRFAPLHSREPNGDVDAAAWTGEERA
jgi:uncharacterized protein